MTNEIFQEQLDIALNLHSDKTAIECGSSQVSYRQLLQNAQAISAVLTKQFETQKGRFAGILSTNRKDIIYAITGISRAGGVFVPLDAALPQERILQMVDSIGLSIILTSRDELQRAGLEQKLTGDVTILFIEDIIKDTPVDSPVVKTLPTDALYIYFTSGSTGRPKAIAGKNKSLLHFVKWEIEAFQIKANSRFSQLITPGFDAFLRDVFVPLFSGGTICIPENPKAIFNEKALTNWAHQERIEYIHCVPSVFRLLNNAEIHGGLFPELKYIFLSGEKIIPAELANWYKQFGDRTRLVNFYGTTETTLISAFYCIRPADASRENIPVGKPMADAELRILDNDLKPVGPLQTGELYIGTAYSSLGYYNDKALNEKKFIADTGHAEPDFVLFKTGDKARMLESGDIELLGRIDRQIKLRGMRIEPEEIEQILIKHQLVKDAVVDVVEVNGQQVLNAFLVLAGTEEGLQTKEEIDWHLRAFLPDYMVPAQLIIIKELPRKVNGKIDYHELKQYVPDNSAGKTAPVTEDEKQLFNLWSGIIRTDKFGIKDTFFEVGGNSFHLINLVAKVHSTFKVRLSIQEIFLHNTVEKLAAFIAGKTKKNETVIPVAPLQETYPLSSGQFQIYQQQQLQPHSTTYNLPQFFILKGALDTDKLKEAFQQLSEIHPALRTGFIFENDEPVQFILDKVNIDVVYKDTPAWTAEEELQYLQRFVKPFDLSKAPLLRAEILKKDKDHYLLLIDVHHIVADGVSQKILNRDLLRLYGGKKIQPTELQYKDFAVWQNKERANRGFEKQQQYWLKRLASPPPLIPLPTDYSSYDPSSAEGAVFDFTLSAKQSEEIKKLVKEKQVTLFSFFLSVYYILLSKLSGQKDLVIGTAASGRRLQSLEHIAGMFINILALREYVDPDTSFYQFLKQVQEQSMEALENQDLPFDEVVRQLKLPRSRNNPLFNVMLVYQNMDIAQEEHPGFTAEAYPFVQQTSKFDITLFVREINNTISFKAEYSTQLFYEQQVARFMKYFSEIITSLLEDPGVKIRDILLSHDLEEAIGGNEQIEFNF